MNSDPDSKTRSGELAAEVVQDVQRLASLEVALAKQELKELAITRARGDQDPPAEPPSPSRARCSGASRGVTAGLSPAYLRRLELV
jgi:hypothetical protein